MNTYLFMEMLKLSNVYNEHLTSLDDLVKENLNKLPTKKKYRCLVDLHKEHNKVMKSSMTIANKIKAFSKGSEE